jgi:hypothetical protein
VRETFEKSSDLKRRVMNMEQEYANRLKAAAQTKLGKAYAFAVNDLGMRLQRDADMFACVSGWDAAYNEKKTELMKEDGLSMPEIERAAVIHADRILADTQPTSNPLYQSKGFREAPKAFKFFSTPLEKMFQTAAGIPEQVKRGQLAYAARYAAGIAITGLAIALFQRKFDDEDEPEELLKKLAYYGVAEPALAHLPLAMLSSSAAWAAERMITGEKRPSPQRDFLPLLSTGERVVSDLDNGKIDRLALDALEFSGYLLGMPTAQIKRMAKAWKEGDPWGVVAGSK